MQRSTYLQAYEATKGQLITKWQSASVNFSKEHVEEFNEAIVDAIWGSKIPPATQGAVVRMLLLVWKWEVAADAYAQNMDTLPRSKMTVPLLALHTCIEKQSLLAANRLGTRPKVSPDERKLVAMIQAMPESALEALYTRGKQLLLKNEPREDSCFEELMTHSEYLIGKKRAMLGLAHSNVLSHFVNNRNLPVPISQLIGEFVSGHINKDKPFVLRLPIIVSPNQLQTALQEMAATVMDHSMSSTRERLKRILDAIPDEAGEQKRKKQRLEQEEKEEAARRKEIEEKRARNARRRNQFVVPIWGPPAAAAAAAAALAEEDLDMVGPESESDEEE